MFAFDGHIYNGFVCNQEITNGCAGKAGFTTAVGSERVGPEICLYFTTISGVQCGFLKNSYCPFGIII